MKGIERRNWLIKGNKLTNKLPNVSATINIKSNENGVYYEVAVTDEYLNSQTLMLYTFEDVVDFVENDLIHCQTTNEAVLKYNALFGSGFFKNNVDGDNISEIDLNTSQVKEAITDYFADTKTHPIYPYFEVSMKNGEPDVKFYLNEHVGKAQSYNTSISQEELGYILQRYAALRGCELLDYKFIGGVHGVGYYFSENTPHFDGIKLYVQKLEKGAVLNKKINNE
jgi:hypothetical protein